MFREMKNHHDVLGIPDTRETGPANVGAVGEERNEVLRFGELAQVRGPLDTASEQSRRSHYDEGMRDKTRKKKKKSGDGPRKKKNLGIGKESGEEKEEEKEKRRRRKGSESEEYKKAGVETAETPFHPQQAATVPPRAGGEAMLQHAVEHRNQT